MKNLLIYIHPEHRLNPEHEKMLEVQIENSLDYWNKEDIILAFNFPYEYKGIKAIEVPDLINSQYPENPRAIINSKINVIIYLLENKLIEELTWFHDFDAFQLAPLDLPPIGSLGLVCYGVYPKERLIPLGMDFKTRINCGSIFFKPNSLPIFKKLLEKMDKEKLYEEDCLTLMGVGQIMNQTYNIGVRCVKDNLNIAEKPIRIVHFPPDNPKWLKKFKPLLNDKLRKLLDEKFTYIRQS